MKQTRHRAPFPGTATIAALVALTVAAAPCQDRVEVVVRPASVPANSHYAGHREPLLPSPLIHLPFGAVKPQGWLRKQLELQGAGFVGHLTEISGFCNPKGNAWLSPEGIGSNGWEELPYWLRGFAATAFILNDKALIEQAMPWIETAFASQRDDGYFGPRSNLKENGAHDLMSNQNMLFVLRAYYEYSGDKRVLALMKKYFAWEMTIPDNKFFAGGWQVPRNADDMENAYWLYNRTGDPKLLELTAKLQRCGSSWMNIVTGGHNVDFSQGFRKPALFYPQNKDPKFLETTERQWDSIVGTYGQVPGGAFGGDEFARPGYTDPRQAIETCGAVEMMISHQILARITGDPKWADRCENLAFNTLPAVMTADMKALRYLTSPNQVNSDARSKAPELADGGPMQVMNPHDHRCCQHNVGAGWPYFAQTVWMATPGNGLAAVMYAPSAVIAKVGNGVKVAIDEETTYPFDGTVSFTVKPDSAVRFPLYLRVPAWCTGNVKLALNGRPLAVESRPGVFLRIDRTWKSGDTLTIGFPMTVSITTWKANQNSVSVNRGPLTFSVKIGEKLVSYQPERHPEPWPAWEIVPTSPWNYALDFDPANLAAAFRVVTKPWPANNMPFTHDGTPVEIQAKARKLPNWKEDHLGLVDKLQASPVKAAEPQETITMIPMGAARIRLSALPVVGTGPDDREWKLPPEPLVSYSRGAGSDPYEAMFDGKEGQSSHDARTPHFTTYSFGGVEHGKMHWVRRNFDQPLTVSECAVYWFDESPTKGDVRLPKSWRVMWLDGKEWKEVANPGAYGIAADKFNKVTFKPVTTTALRLEVQTQNEKTRYAMGILEWSIPGSPPLAPAGR
jgi:DUF1680 family protein